MDESTYFQFRVIDSNYSFPRSTAGGLGVPFLYKRSGSPFEKKEWMFSYDPWSTNGFDTSVAFNVCSSLSSSVEFSVVGKYIHHARNVASWSDSSEPTSVYPIKLFRNAPACN